MNGDRLWYLFHGFDLTEKPKQSRTIGHSHVLSPSKRGIESSRLTARRLALKAASRLRRKGYVARLLVLHGKFEDDKSNWRPSVKLPATQDSFIVLGAFDRLFPRLAEAGRGRPGGCRLRMIGVTLCDIADVHGEQGALFVALDPDDPLARSTRTLSLSRAMDRINERFGRHAVFGRADEQRARRSRRHQNCVRAHPRPARISRMSPPTARNAPSDTAPCLTRDAACAKLGLL